MGNACVNQGDPGEALGLTTTMKPANYQPMVDCLARVAFQTRDKTPTVILGAQL